MVALPAQAVARLAARVDLDALPFDRAGRYRVYDAAVLRHATPRASPDRARQ
jgi:hypothetical protein